MKGKIILVTGGNRGIGLEICNQLSALGHQVIMGSRDYNKGRMAASSLSGEVEVIALDVSSPESIENSAATIEGDYGKLDVLINNAGIIGASNAVDTSIEDMQNIMQTNFLGPWMAIKLFFPLLNLSNDGRVINVSSGMGAWSSLGAGYAPYRLSKTSLNALTVHVAKEFPKIRTNAMCPGWVKTAMGGAGADRSVEHGAETAVWLATANKIETGCFYRDKTVIGW